MKEHKPRMLFPSVWIQHEPLLKRTVRIKYHKFVPSIYILWRWPWRHEGLPSRKSRIA